MPPSGQRRAVHITTVHAAHDPRIFRKECRTLARAGWDVTLIAPGRGDDSRDGVRIRAIRPRRGRVRRMTMMALDAFRLARAEDPDVVHVHDPELIPVALALRLLGYQVIYDAHEDLPRQISAKPWIPGWLERPTAVASGMLLAFAGHALGAVVAATESVGQRYPRARTTVIHNYPDTNELPSVAPPVRTDGRASIVYVGGLSVARGLHEMVAAVANVSPEFGARLHLAGRFQPDSLQAELESRPGMDHVTLHGWLDSQEVAELLAQASVGICVLHPMPNYVDSLPTKLFEYMAAGLPVVASDFPLWRDIVQTAECGVLVNPLNTAAITAAIEELLRDAAEANARGQRGRQAALTRYAWEGEAEKLLALYDALSAAS